MTPSEAYDELSRRVWDDPIMGAWISEDERYRWAPWRKWDSGAVMLVLIMLNPSTADGRKDDPTIRRAVDFAKRSHFGGILVLNLFSWRASKPTVLRTIEDPVGNNTDPLIWGVADNFPRMCRTTVLVGWGRIDKRWQPRADQVLNTLETTLARVLCFGTTKDGQPRHPLMVPKAQKFEEYRRPA